MTKPKATPRSRAATLVEHRLQALLLALFVASIMAYSLSTHTAAL